VGKVSYKLNTTIFFNTK